MKNKEYTDYHEDIEFGKVGEEIYMNFLKNNDIIFEDLRNDKYSQMIDIDFNVAGEYIDVKYSYKDDYQLCFETHINSNRKYGKLINGWFFNSYADYFAFVSAKYIILVKNDNSLKRWYEKNKNDLSYNRNKPTRKYNKFVESRYFRIDYRFLPQNLIKVIKL